MPGIKYWIDASGVTAGSKKVNTALGSIARKAGSVGKTLGKVFSPMKTAMAAVAGGFGAVKLANIGDAYTNMGSQLEYLTGSAEGAKVAQEQLYQMSQKTGTSMLENSKALTRFALASEMTGLDMEQNVKALGAINTSMIRTGVSTQEASAAMIQLGQALASGRLQGDEFRSMSENAPALMNELAKSLGVSRAALKEMSTQGKLTSEVLGKAFLGMANSASETGEELPLTIGRMWTRVVNATERMWDAINDETGILAWVAQGFDNLATWVEQNTPRVVEFFEQLKNGAIEAWPRIKEFFVQFSGYAQAMWDLFKALWPYIQEGLKNTIKVIEWALPYIKQIITWVTKLIQNLDYLNSRFGGINEAAQNVLTGGTKNTIIEAGKSFFSSDSGVSGGGESTTNSTVNVNINQQQSRSDIVNTISELDRVQSRG